MTVKEIEENHIATKEELHNNMLELGLIEYQRCKLCGIEKQIDEDKLSDFLYQYIDYVNEENKKEKIIITFNYVFNHKVFPSELNDNVYQASVKTINFFEYQDNQYFYWNSELKKSNEDNYLYFIDFLTSLLEHYQDLGDYQDYLKFLLKNYERELKITRSAVNQYQALKDRFQDYDYVKVLHQSDKIGYDDVFWCTQFIGCSEHPNDFSITLEEKMCLLLIIFHGIKNIYFNYSSLYQFEKSEQCFGWIDGLGTWLDFFKNHKDEISHERIYSKEYEYYISLENEINYFYRLKEQETYFFRRYISDYYLLEPLQLIYFEYLIKKDRYEDARNYLEYNPIFLYSNVIDNLKRDSNRFVDSMVDSILTDYSLAKKDLYTYYTDLDELFHDANYKKLYVTPMLHFLIDYYYLLKYEKKEKEMELLYSFLSIFDKGFDLEDFFTQCKYERLLLKLTNDKVEDMDQIDEAVNNISNKIDKFHLVDDFDQEKVRKRYPRINFDNLGSQVQRYIATGDTILMVFDDSNHIDFDYSSAVIEWSKAVELETYNKLTKQILNHEDEIKRQISDDKFKLGDTIGVFDAIHKRKVKDGRNLSQFLFDEYYSEMYSVTNEQYNDLMTNILKIYGTRNDSAHKYKSISFDRAKECHDIILSAKMILEMLSKLEKK